MGGLDKPRVLAIGGPTASGKTSLSVELAKRLNGEVICVDSMQIYRGLDVGTAKVTEEEMQGVPHHLVGFLAPEEAFSVADFVALADRCIRDISARGKLPVLVGGTGLYMESLLCGLRFAEQKTDPAVRRQLEELYQRAEQLLKEEIPTRVGEMLGEERREELAALRQNIRREIGKMGERTDRSYLHAARHLWRNPTAVSERFRDALDELRKNMEDRYR